uniref:NUMOD3 domain-containing DNA-binding protein n=1 Tax=Mycolicibacterium sarraceniae TaxID=1534348 RepID=UPI00389924EB
MTNELPTGGVIYGITLRSEFVYRYIGGSENPNFGKFGADHPSFGHVISEEARRKLAEQRRGAGNPNYGCRASDETRAKMSAVRKGRPMPSSKRSAHTRHHTNRGIKKDDCRYCIEDSD